MKKSKVYTKGGDKGETSLVSGTRISKSAERINLYGNLDELNSHVGYLLSLCNENNLLTEIQKTFFQKLQSTFFDLGSKLACEDEFWDKYKLPDIKPEIISEMEGLIDLMDSEVPELKSFILPGGSRAASYAHIVRTSCRRVERDLIQSRDSGICVPELSVELLNRFSDFAFVLSRKLNYQVGEDEVLWVPNSI